MSHSQPKDNSSKPIAWCSPFARHTSARCSLRCQQINTHSVRLQSDAFAVQSTYSFAFSLVFLKDVSASALKDLIQFMYCGEVNVKQEALPAFISTAEQLQIKGLTESVSTKHNLNITQRTNVRLFHDRMKEQPQPPEDRRQPKRSLHRRHFPKQRRSAHAPQLVSSHRALKLSRSNPKAAAMRSRPSP